MFVTGGADMTIDFYTISDAPNVVNKTLGQKTTYSNVDVYTPCNVMSPTLIMVYSDTLTAFNYLQIPAFNNRYYYITTITVQSGGMCVVSCSIDVLMTYSAAILTAPCTCIRSESIGKNYIADSKYPINTADRYVTLDNFPKTPFTRNPTYPYVLTTIGGTS